MLFSASMDPFVRRLIQRLQDPSEPLSRNRHFHTFDNPDGRYALRMARRLKALQREILACTREGHRARFSRRLEADGGWRIELSLDRVHGRRTSWLAHDEFELLAELPGVREALEECEPAPV